MNEDHADALEAREKAGVDAPVDGMLSKRDRELWRKAVARGSFCEDVRTNANIVYLIDSHDACERALRDSRNLLREAEARGDEWKRVANERGEALREAQAQLSAIRKAVDVHGGLSLFPVVEAVTHLAKANRANQSDLGMAEKRITALEKALIPFTGRFKDYVGLEDEWDSHQSFTIGDCRKADEALAQQPPQATAEPKEAK